MNAIADALPADELAAFRDLARRYARKALEPHRTAHEFPWRRDMDEAVREAAEAGLFALTLPGELGGCGLEPAALTGVLREIAAVDGGAAGLLFTHAAALDIIAGDAGAAIDAALVAPLAAAPGLPLAFASCSAPEETPPLTVSERDGQPRLTGSLPFLVLGKHARHAVVAGAPAGVTEFSYFLVDLGEPGVTRSAPLLTLGFQCCGIVDATFDDVPALRIGTAGDGADRFRAMQARLSPACVAIAVGIMEGAFDAALDYARQRFQGGRHLIDWPGMRMKLADMAVRIDVARACLAGLPLAGTTDAGRCRAAIAASLHAGELACSVASEGMQVLGGNGYMKDFGQEKRLRDARQARTLLGLAALRKLHCIDSVITENIA